MMPRISEKPSELLEQYKLYVEMADRASARRNEANKLYISLLLGLFAIISLAMGQNIPSDIRKIIFVTFSLVGIALCLVWISNIHSYKLLNSTKFKIICYIERKLAFPCYDLEWQILKRNTNKFNYTRLSKIEQLIPIILILSYFTFIIFSLSL